jgi:Tol biopolymer transport system component
MNADGSEPKQLTAGALVSRGLAVSPDGRYIFFASDRAGHFNSKQGREEP